MGEGGGGKGGKHFHLQSLLRHSEIFPKVYCALIQLYPSLALDGVDLCRSRRNGALHFSSTLHRNGKEGRNKSGGRSKVKRTSEAKTKQKQEQSKAKPIRSRAHRINAQTQTNEKNRKGRAPKRTQNEPKIADPLELV